MKKLKNESIKMLRFLGMGVVMVTLQSNVYAQSAVNMDQSMLKALACDELVELDKTFDLNKSIMSSHTKMKITKISIAQADLDKIIKDYNRSASEILAAANDGEKNGLAIKLISATNQKIAALNSKLGFRADKKVFDASNTYEKLINDLINRSAQAGAEEAITDYDFSSYLTDERLKSAQSLSLAIMRLLSEDDRVIKNIQSGEQNLKSHMNEYAYALSLVLNLLSKEDIALKSNQWAAEFSRQSSAQIKKMCPEE